MTVQYNQDVLDSSALSFLKLFRRWKGGVFKLIYVDFIIFGVVYSLISLTYRFILDDSRQQVFEKVVRYVYQSQSLIPVAFILGFYVSLIYNRFWEHFNIIPWITKIAILVAGHITNDNNNAVNKNKRELQKCKEEVRKMKRSIIRYLVSGLVITLSRVSKPMKRRFPTLDSLCKGDILLEHEVEEIKNTHPLLMQPFLPVFWCTSIVSQARVKNYISNESILYVLVKEINNFRYGLQKLFLLDQVCVPLVYTQVVTLAVYSYFCFCLIGRQYIRDRTDFNSTQSVSKDYYVPFFTLIEFVVYVGWLKLALTLVNPLGEDDEDFDLDCIVNYNFEVGLEIVDKVTDHLPALSKDKYFDDVEIELPLERDLNDSQCQPFIGSVYDLKIEKSDDTILSLNSIASGESKKNERKSLFRSTSRRSGKAIGSFEHLFPSLEEEQNTQDEVNVVNDNNDADVEEGEEGKTPTIKMTPIKASPNYHDIPLSIITEEEVQQNENKDT